MGLPLCQNRPMKRTPRKRFVAAGVALGLVLGSLAPSLLEGAHTRLAHAANPGVTAVAAERAFKLHQAGFQTGTVPLDQVYEWSKRWRDADKSNKDAAKAHLARMKALEADVLKRVAAGTLSSADEAAAAFYVAEAIEQSP